MCNASRPRALARIWQSSWHDVACSIGGRAARSASRAYRRFISSWLSAASSISSGIARMAASAAARSASLAYACIIKRAQHQHQARRVKWRSWRGSIISVRGGMAISSSYRQRQRRRHQRWHFRHHHQSSMLWRAQSMAAARTRAARRQRHHRHNLRHLACNIALYQHRILM